MANITSPAIFRLSVHGKENRTHSKETCTLCKETHTLDKETRTLDKETRTLNKETGPGQFLRRLSCHVIKLRNSCLNFPFRYVP